jgi:hypothetical protein
MSFTFVVRYLTTDSGNHLDGQRIYLTGLFWLDSSEAKFFDEEDGSVAILTDARALEKLRAHLPMPHE